MSTYHQLLEFKGKVFDNFLFIFYNIYQIFNYILILSELFSWPFAGEMLHLSFKIIYQFGLLCKLNIQRPYLCMSINYQAHICCLLMLNQ